ncbi:MAG TPA: copper oxidase [Gemmatimonadaceae bacterium]|nr:copper oxidase [Gemmatimonadaceae bacterium]
MQNPVNSEDATALAAPTTRRRFLRDSATAALVMGALGACKEGPAAKSASAATLPKGATPSSAAPPDSAATIAAARANADAMDAMHEKPMKAFPAKTSGKGNQILAPTMVSGVKQFSLTAKKIQWEVLPGQFMEAWAYNDQVPGPQIRVREGDRVRVILNNQLPESTVIHFHGLEVPNAVDGVSFITQPPVKPGDSYTYEFTVPNSGSHMYHSHHDSAKQVGLGLLGAFIVEPKVPRDIEAVDIDHVMVINDGPHGYTFNGKSFPATEPIVAKVGQTLRIRFMNEGMMIHPMHLHGMHMTLIDKDGWPLPAPWRCDTLNVAPGERWDAIVHCTNPGTWAFHCHILMHAESDHGMFGMVTALVVQA